MVKLNEGLGISLFHAIIRLSFALTVGSEEEVVRYLAYLSSSYDSVVVDYKPIDNKKAKDEFNSFIKERDKYFCLTGNSDEKEEVLLDALCE
jgi:hypothetical protein